MRTRLVSMSATLAAALLAVGSLLPASAAPDTSPAMPDVLGEEVAPLLAHISRLEALKKDPSRHGEFSLDKELACTELPGATTCPLRGWQEPGEKHETIVEAAAHEVVDTAVPSGDMSMGDYLNSIRKLSVPEQIDVMLDSYRNDVVGYYKTTQFAGTFAHLKQAAAEADMIASDAKMHDMDIDHHVGCIEATKGVRYCPLSGWYYDGIERKISTSSAAYEAIQKLPAAEKWQALRDDLATALSRAGALKEGPAGLALVQHFTDRMAGLFRA